MRNLDVFLNKDLGVGADVNWGRMVPQATKQAQYNAESRCFPLHERCDFHSLTLDGRGLSLCLQEPPVDDQGEEAGDVPATAKGPVLGAPSGVVSDVAPPAAPPAPVPAGKPGRFVTDALGRRYPVEEFGFRIWRSSRPPGIPPEIWSTLNAEKKLSLIHI